MRTTLLQKCYELRQYGTPAANDAAYLNRLKALPVDSLKVIYARLARAASYGAVRY